MRMCDVRVGMRLEAVGVVTAFTPITVTALTQKGFKFILDSPMPFISRDGSFFPIDGHEHFGLNGETFYEIINDRKVPGFPPSEAEKILTNIATKAARIVKICRLTGSNLHDDVSVRLNARPTHEEIQQAKMWQLALELATVDEDVFVQARDLRRRIR